MDKITLKAYAKINLGLEIVGIRPDGYHDIRTPMHTVDLCDEITIIVSNRNIHTMECNVDGIPCDDTNLCLKAVNLLDEMYRLKRKYHIILDKKIPSQAGLGGGSADGACVLRAINELENLDIEPMLLSKLGAKLGADVPFCVLGGCMLAEGIGDRLTQLNPILDGNILIVKPEFNISTATAYKLIDESDSTFVHNTDDICKAINEGSLDRLAKLINDANAFEVVIKKLHPTLDELLLFLKRNGAMGAGLSGSGAAVYGIFDSKELANRCKDRLYDSFKADFAIVAKTIVGG